VQIAPLIAYPVAGFADQGFSYGRLNGVMEIPAELPGFLMRHVPCRFNTNCHIDTLVLDYLKMSDRAALGNPLLDII
jgi:hypothetical protein